MQATNVPEEAVQFEKVVCNVLSRAKSIKKVEHTSAIYSDGWLSLGTVSVKRFLPNSLSLSLPFTILANHTLFSRFSLYPHTANETSSDKHCSSEEA